MKYLNLSEVKGI